MEKRCNRCERDLPLDGFHRRGGIQQSWCKDCRRTYDAEYWRRTRVARIELRKERRAELAEWHRRLKDGRPCVDCGRVFHHAAMQWDHLPGFDKRREVSTLVRRGFRRDTILDEIAKCELVCANCHAVRTFERRGVAQPG
ncbi:MAG TPA: hypothetical protein VFR43_10755 [Gaiellaceae bacterium]|nr:hypothetical protein [Gaiellaceae bacterium]